MYYFSYVLLQLYITSVMYYFSYVLLQLCITSPLERRIAVLLATQQSIQAHSHDQP
jgi:hypothetical protein